MPRPPELSTAARALRESIFSRLAGKLARHGEDGVPLHLGDTWLPPPPGLRLEERETALWRYGAPAGEAGLLDALAAKLRARNQLDWVEPAHLQVTVGATQALQAAARAVVEPGDEVVVPTPHWPLIRGIVTNVGGLPIETPLSQLLYEDATRDPAALLERVITPRTVALYVITPNNPDGKVLDRKQLGAIAELARARNLWVLADEVYEDLAYSGEHVSIASLPGMAERTLTVFSLSKSYALAGYRLGYAVGPPALMKAVRKIANHTVYNVPDVLQRAAARLLADPASDRWLADARTTYLAARELAASLVRAPHHLPDGATYLFLDLAPYVGDQPEAIWPLVEQLLDEGVSISPGEQFGRGYERHARICFTAVPPNRLQVGLERLDKVLARVRTTPR
jgi:aspartate/methionine/tyrosine aminotransferase